MTLSYGVRFNDMNLRVLLICNYIWYDRKCKCNVFTISRVRDRWPHALRKGSFNAENESQVNNSACFGQPTKTLTYSEHISVKFQRFQIYILRNNHSKLSICTECALNNANKSSRLKYEPFHLSYMTVNVYACFFSLAFPWKCTVCLQHWVDFNF